MLRGRNPIALGVRLVLRCSALAQRDEVGTEMQPGDNWAAHLGMSSSRT